MQVIDNSSVEYKHFFFRGHRVTGGVPSTGTNVDEIGVLAIRQHVTTAGEVLNDEDVLTQDLHYDPQNDPPTTPVRIESDLAATKPGLDVLVVRNEIDLPDFSLLGPTPVPPGLLPIPFPVGIFGHVDVLRQSGGTDPIDSVHYGWFPRNKAGRVELAGDAAALEVFNPANAASLPPHNGDILPEDYVDQFQNAARNNAYEHVTSGDELVFEERDVNDLPTGPVFSVTIPEAATLTFLLDDAPMNPQPVMDFAVDTVCLDLVADRFFLTWRAVFEWQTTFESAVLEVS